MEEEEILKMEYINENIIEKGIDLEDISTYVKNKTGEDFNSLSLTKLKDMLQLFNNRDKDDQKKVEDKPKESAKPKEETKSKEETKPKIEAKPKVETKPKEELKPKEEFKQKIKTKEKDTKKNISSVNTQNGLYTPEVYNFKTGSQPKNKLLELSQNNNLISVTVSDPKKEVAGFLKAIYSYRIQCPQLNSDNRRTYEDFEWFRNQLIIRYPLRLIPPVMKQTILKQLGNIFKIESEEIIEQRKVRYLNKFINAILQKQILRTSPIFYEFLVLDENLFKKYQNKLDLKKYQLEIPLNNLITTKGKIKCSLTNNSIEEANKLINKYTTLSDLYNKIDSMMNNINNDLNNLSLHMKEMSTYFDMLNDNLN